MAAPPERRWNAESPALRVTSAKETPRASVGAAGGATSVGGRGRPSARSRRSGGGERRPSPAGLGAQVGVGLRRPAAPARAAPGLPERSLRVAAIVRASGRRVPAGSGPVASGARAAPPPRAPSRPPPSARSAAGRCPGRGGPPRSRAPRAARGGRSRRPPRGRPCTRRRPRGRTGRRSSTGASSSARAYAARASGSSTFARRRSPSATRTSRRRGPGGEGRLELGLRVGAPALRREALPPQLVGAGRARGQLHEPSVLDLGERPGGQAEVVERVGVARVAAPGLPEAVVGGVEAAHRRLGAGEEDAGRDVAGLRLEPLVGERLRPRVVSAVEGAGVVGRVPSRASRRQQDEGQE